MASFMVGRIVAGKYRLRKVWGPDVERETLERLLVGRVEPNEAVDNLDCETLESHLGPSVTIESTPKYWASTTKCLKEVEADGVFYASDGDWFYWEPFIFRKLTTNPDPKGNADDDGLSRVHEIMNAEIEAAEAMDKRDDLAKALTTKLLNVQIEGRFNDAAHKTVVEINNGQGSITLNLLELGDLREWLNKIFEPKQKGGANG